MPASAQPYAVVTALAVLSLIAGDQDDPSATSPACRAVAIAEARGVNFEPLCGIVYLALGRALARHGGLVEVEEQLGRALLGSTACWCTARSRCCCWRPCVRVAATFQYLRA